MLRRILISEPGATASNPYLPYVWAVLKTSSETVDKLSGQFQWLEPIYLPGCAADLIAPYNPGSVDILGLSCYTWNFELQCEIARLTKAANPACLVVAGGPEPDIKNGDFFQRHPYIDVVVSKDGELTFNKLLLAICAQQSSFSHIPGLFLPSAHDRSVTSTGAPELPNGFHRSPYIEQSAYFETLVATHGPGQLNAVWETNRGCPYSCSFCDWGSNTMSKIRRFDMERVKREAEWLARIKPQFVFLADANFGILPRDLEIAQSVVEAHGRYGYPRFLYYSPAKNNPDRALAIARKFAECGVSPTHTLAIQHTDPDVLASTDRENISSEKQRDVARTLLDAGIPIDVHLILGIPGDSYDRWKNCLADLMSWGIHEDYSVFFYNLLPNAPAGDQSFISDWGIETMHRRTRERSRAEARGAQLELRERTVVASNTFTRQDWVRMNTYSSFVRALHCKGVTRLIAVYLHLTHGISYREFYEAIIETFMAPQYNNGRLYREVEGIYQAALSDDIILDQVELDELPNFPLSLSIWQAIFFRVCFNFDRFFDELERFLLLRFASISNLKSVIEYQRNLIILPTYDVKKGRCFRVDHNWPGYFAAAAKCKMTDRLGEPELAVQNLIWANDTVYEEGYTVTSIDWSPFGGAQRWDAWLQGLVCRTSARACNLRSLTIARPEAVSTAY